MRKKEIGKKGDKKSGEKKGFYLESRKRGGKDGD